MLPMGLAQNGLVALGSARYLDTEPVIEDEPDSGPKPVPLGLCVPAVADEHHRPDPTEHQGMHHGSLLFDHDLKRLIYWDGTAWRAIQTIP